MNQAGETKCPIKFEGQEIPNQIIGVYTPWLHRTNVSEKKDIQIKESRFFRVIFDVIVEAIISYATYMLMNGSSIC